MPWFAIWLNEPKAYGRKMNYIGPFETDHDAETMAIVKRPDDFPIIIEGPTIIDAYANWKNGQRGGYYNQDETL